MTRTIAKPSLNAFQRFFVRLKRDGFGAWRKRQFWGHLASQDVNLQYARSLIGPFWLTLTMALQLVALTFLFTGLFGAPIEIVAPWVTIGVIVWTFMAASLNEATSVLVFNKPYLLEAEASVLGFVMAVVFRNLIVSLHHLILLVILCVWFALIPTQAWLWLLIAIPLLIVFTTSLSVILALATARFRDIQRIIENLMMVGFFLTPVLWRPQELVRNEFIATYNPFTHLIAIIREPLLGNAPTELAWLVSGWATLACVIGAIYAIGRYRNRLLFWI